MVFPVIVCPPVSKPLFSKDNAQALVAANRDFVMLCKSLDLSGAELVAIDGSFFRGNLARHSIHTRARLNRQRKRIEAHIQQVLQQLETSDAAQQAYAPDDMLLAHLEETGQTQYAEVDPDARLLTGQARMWLAITCRLPPTTSAT